MVLLHINFLLNYLILEHFSLSYLLQLSKIDKKKKVKKNYAKRNAFKETKLKPWV